MKVRVLSIPVQNQDNALKFYTKILGFVEKFDIPLTEDNRVNGSFKRTTRWP